MNETKSDSPNKKKTEIPKANNEVLFTLVSFNNFEKEHLLRCIYYPDFEIFFY